MQLGVDMNASSCLETDGAPAGGERRQGQRHRTVLRVAVLAPEGAGRRLCLVRNISDGGAMLQVEGVAIGQRVVIELQPEKAVESEIVWVKERHAGLRFAAPTDWASLLKPEAPSKRWHPRKPRIPIDRLATVRIGWDRHWVGVQDVSQGGVRVDTDLGVPPGTSLVVTPDGLRPLGGCVRWRRDDSCGISFNEVLPLQEINAWLLASGQD